MSALEQFQAAHAAHVKGDLAKAERLYSGIRLSMPYHANHNLGVVLMTQSKFKAAEQAFRAALEAEPGDARSLFNIGQLRLAEGDYATGLDLWENRRGVPGMLRSPPTVNAPEWEGGALDGPLLVCGEQGLGDHIMFARFLEPLAARGVEVVFSAPEILHGVFAGLPVRLITPAQEADAGPYAAWVFLGSLARLSGARVETLPPPTRLTAPPLSSGGGIGVVVRGNRDNKNDSQRTPGPRDQAKLLALGRDLSPEATGARSFSDTAKIVAELDLVISVDTSGAHLAASLGKPTWVLLQAAETDWRWLRNRADSPWYPTARLFRQRTPGDWAPVIRQVESALASRPPA